MKFVKIIGIIWAAMMVLTTGIFLIKPGNKPSLPPVEAVVTANVMFDNGTAGTVKVRVDGKEITTVPAHDLTTGSELRAGKHQVEILGSNGKTIEKQSINIARNAANGTFVYNVAQANRYAVYTIGYGETKAATPRRPLPASRFFQAESGIGRLGEGFPGTIKVRKGSSGTTYSLLGHQPLHAKGKCCERLRASLKK